MSISTASAGTMVAAQAVGRHRRRVVQRLAELRRHPDRQQDHRRSRRPTPRSTCRGYSPFYFRTAPPDTRPGQRARHPDQPGRLHEHRLPGVQRHLRHRSAQRRPGDLEAAGGKCVYGCKGDGDEFPAGQTTFSAEVQAVHRCQARRDRHPRLRRDQVDRPRAGQPGWDMSKTYFTDGNTADYSEDFEPGTLEGAQGTHARPGPRPGLQGPARRLVQDGRGRGPHGLLLRRRVLRRHHPGRARRGQGRRQRLRDDPEELRRRLGCDRRRGVHHLRRLRRRCSTAGKEIHYTGPSGIGPINDENDPSSAFIGIYQFDANNKNIAERHGRGLSSS